MSPPDDNPNQPDRRKHPRVKVRVPVELRLEGSTAPIGAATADLSLGGCYIEMTFTLAKDTKLELTLQIDGTLLAAARVVTCDPNFGNGIEFEKMLPEDVEELRRFLEDAQQGPPNE
jgi:PilZ domain